MIFRGEAGADQAGHEQAVTGNQCGKTYWKVSLGKEGNLAASSCLGVIFILFISAEL